MSLLGNWRTESDRMAWTPAMRITRLTTIARTGRRMKRSVNFMLAVLGLGSRVVRRLHLVVDQDRSAVAQLEDPRGHDFLAGLHTRGHCDLVAAGAAQLHELLAYAAVALAVGRLHFSDDEDRVAIGRVANGRRRKRDDRARRRQQHVR